MSVWDPWTVCGIILMNRQIWDNMDAMLHDTIGYYNYYLPVLEAIDIIPKKSRKIKAVSNPHLRWGE